MAESSIQGFHEDDEGHWVADLACGHAQHLRHKPPFENRALVTTEKGRAELIGMPLDCLFCNMATLPSGLVVYGGTRVFDETSVPKGLLANHTTKAGTWGRIVVQEGRLLYTVGLASWIIRPGVVGIVEPRVLHHVTPQGPVRFLVEFLHRQKF